MKGIQVKEYVKGPEDLLVATLPDPAPKSDEYLIEVRAAATNFFDLLQIRGKYQHQPPLPWISGMEFAGTIISTPSGNRNPAFKRGDRVFGAAQGAYATKVGAKEDVLHFVPEGWEFEDAAGLYVTAPTSYAALVTRANLQPHETVLVHAGAGGVGLAAIQVAKSIGATVIATASTEHKLSICKSFGADHLINYASTPNWVSEVQKITRRKGVDVVFDPVGLIDTSMKCIAFNGRLLVIGFASGKIEKVALNRVLLKNVSIVGLHWGIYKDYEPETVRLVWKELMKLIGEGKFKPTVYRGEEFVGLENVGRALKALGGRETWGKVVVKVPKEEGSKL
ncbi:hypothetical protein RUND412_005450 [Rhizina undulata]